MRPLQLSFSGIRSYAGDCGPLDFTGKTLIGILGDTGAGKSTILEAITFALYGSPSWNKREVAPLVADGATAMRVDFTFVHEDQRWRVRRIFHTNTTPSTHSLVNLDTGEKYDNAGSVNKKIESLIMSFESFQAAVLLPQGRFDQLLTASGGDRTGLLKGIFGTQVIDSMRGLATEYRERLMHLLHEARLARKGLRDDPASEAEAARVAAEQSEQKTARLTETLKHLRDTQREAIGMRDRREDLTKMLGELDRHRIDGAETLDKVRPAARRLAEQTEELATRKKSATTRRAEAGARLETAEAQGETPNSLSSAETMLAGVPDRLAALASEREEWAQEDKRLVKEAARLEEMDTELSEARITATERGTASDAAADALAEARESVRLLRDAVGTLLGDGVAVARSFREVDEAEQNVGSRRGAIPPLRTAVEEAESAIASAGVWLDAVHRREAAHLLGADLAAGDPCPVCVRPLPGDYRAPDALDPEAFRAAQHAKDATADERNRATKALSRAEADFATARETAAKRRQATEQSCLRLDQAREAVIRAIQGDVWPRSETPAWDRAAFTGALETAIATLSTGDPVESDRLRAEILAELLEPAESFEQELAQTAGSVRTVAINAKICVETLERSLHELRESHGQASRRASAAKQRHAAAEERFRSELDALPGIAREALPADLLQLGAQDVMEARRAVSERHDELKALVRDRDEAHAELLDIAKRERVLDQRRRAEVTNPLQSLVTGLNRWTETLQDAAQMIGRPYARPPVPHEPTIDAAAQYADAVIQPAAKVRQAMRTELTNVSGRAEELVAKLGAQASALQEGDAEATGTVAPSQGVDPLDAAFLDPLKDAATTARNEAARWRAEQAEAESQIERADTLDRAIKAGHARHAAMEKLRSLLTEAKFEQYLIDQRTLALLGLASDIFGQLSDGEFGFGLDFQIVSRASNTSRSPKTLSGGETFLASLALALALVELYSRTGTRLGALFLDEGFGSLDVDTLIRALAVLRSETGGDKLVTVISHLHAVAEAVEDVLWVERRPAGSVARWLNNHERDALVREDVSSGLLRLA
jgi:exonuclease SbcC